RMDRDRDNGWGACNPNAERDAFTYANRYCEGNRDGHSPANPFTNTDGNRDSYSDRSSYAFTDTDGDGHRHSDRSSYSVTYIDGNGHCHSNRSNYSFTNPDAGYWSGGSL